MAGQLLRLQPLLPFFQPLLQPLHHPAVRLPLPARISFPVPPQALAIWIPTFAGVSSIVRDIWDGLLRAVPKKKTSHMKKRHRQMAGKALRNVNTVKCPSCGKAKLPHHLCPFCVDAIKNWMKKEPNDLEAIVGAAR